MMTLNGISVLNCMILHSCYPAMQMCCTPELIIKYIPSPMCSSYPTSPRSLLERNETRRVGGTDTGPTVFDRLAVKELVQ